MKNFILPFKLHLDMGGTSRDTFFPKKYYHILFSEGKYLFSAPLNFYLYFLPYKAGGKDELSWSCGDFLSVFNIFSSRKRNAADTR